MAKPVKAATTRIAATLTARYTPSSGATDAFFMDGRMNGRREQRAADITLDREDRGFFYATYAHAGASGADENATTRARRALDRMLQNMKQTGRNIDSEINELADTAVEVSGRITLQHETVRQPYFAGVIVRDSELAAITMGGGCAYLYRNNVLYPLTTDDYPLEPIDRDGNPVDRLNLYCAGVAGTVRYSNIAQLQVDDCIIVCNRELMEAVGQRELLRLLDEAEDQCDAAGLVMTAASAKLPGTSMQFLIGFVETIAPTDKSVRYQGRAGAAAGGAFGAAAAVAASGSGSDSGTGYESAAPVPAGKLFKSAADNGLGGTAVDAEPTADEFGRSRRLGSDRSLPEADANNRNEYPFDAEGAEFENPGRGRKIAFYAIIALVSIACLFAIYSMLFKKPSTSATTTRKTTVASTTLATSSTTSGTTTASGSSTTTTKSSVNQTTSGGTTQTGAIALPAKYTVVSGDTLTSISKKFYGASTPDLWKLIRDANGLTSDNLKLGQVLTIPAKP